MTTIRACIIEAVMAIIIGQVVCIMALIEVWAIMELVGVAVGQLYFEWVPKPIARLELMVRVGHKDELLVVVVVDIVMVDIIGGEQFFEAVSGEAMVICTVKH